MMTWLREFAPGLRGLAVEALVVAAAVLLALAAGLVALAVS